MKYDTSKLTCLMMAACANFAASGFVSPFRASAIVVPSLESASMLSKTTESGERASFHEGVDGNPEQEKGERSFVCE